LRGDTAIRETAAYPSWSPDGKRLVFSVRNDGGRRIAEWEIGSLKIIDLTRSSFHTVKTPVYSIDGQWVFYSSNKSGLEAVWAVSRNASGENDPKHYLAAQRWYGAYKPFAALDGKAIYVIEYASAEGEVISRIELQTSMPGNRLPGDREQDEFAGYIHEENPEASTRDAEIRNPEKRDEIIAVGDMDYPESDYHLTEHAFNFHSWGLYLGRSSNSFLGNELVLNIQSRDVLGTLSFEAGALYEVTESSPGAYLDLSFTGIRPVIGIRGEYRYRSPQSDPFHQTPFSLSALYPANLARTGIWNHTLDIGIAGGLLSYFTNGIPAEHYPFISYVTDWSRLRPGSKRAIRPDLGWRLRTIYSHILLTDNYGDSVSAELDIYFPGGFKNTSLSFGSGIEHRTANFTPRISQPRGYEWENPELTLVGTVDYEFPLGYPDLPLGSVIFIQRFRLGLFSDFGFIGTTTEEPLEKRWSTGAALTMDFSAFNNFPGLSIGIQFSWLWQDMTPRIDLMVMELSLF
ncbi:MAG: PD40 domain-containing protein, partial [Spirochaetaceae bacterium]|nr:PD40 domain-containing protein [Spirochaetaceae bacterium]